MPEKTLTLEQVKKAGRSALHDAGFRLFVYPDGEIAFEEWPGVSLLDLARLPRDGWHHLPGCDCELCRGGEQTSLGLGEVAPNA